MNGTVQEPEWLAAHLYYPEPLTALLTEAAAPFIRWVMENRWADRYFFIRYWERGPHVRLRFLGMRETLETQVKPALQKHFNDYFHAHPAERREPETLNAASEDQRWFPNLSIQYIPYEPEVERYGGPAGLRIAEKQFQHSSRAALAVMSASDDWDYTRALGAAIQMHLGFTHALGMDLKETHRFYSHIFHSWFFRSYAYGGDPTAPITPETGERRETVRKAFEENFQGQKDMLIAFHREIWEAFSQDCCFEEEWLNEWISGMKAVGDEYRGALADGRLEFFSWMNLPEKNGQPDPKAGFWTILNSLVHMTNNRLGILNHDEAYLGYLIQRSLEVIQKDG